MIPCLPQAHCAVLPTFQLFLCFVTDGISIIAQICAQCTTQLSRSVRHTNNKLAQYLWCKFGNTAHEMLVKSVCNVNVCPCYSTELVLPNLGQEVWPKLFVQVVLQ